MSKRSSKHTKWQRAAAATDRCGVCHRHLRIYRRRPGLVCKRCATVQDMLASMSLAERDEAMRLLLALRKDVAIDAQILPKAPSQPASTQEASPTVGGHARPSKHGHD
eukprot:TRINITY_DN10229_c0_g1_i1.p5 TRINITY_DN10229_c0_g1~~TRINITY_DN10229_c0_g1_i1.p5  ORF type:complete len:108 (+),score=11.47 TRINITY_DN10229_c0_g1_i1:3942-4265(+)